MLLAVSVWDPWDARVGESHRPGSLRPEGLRRGACAAARVEGRHSDRGPCDPETRDAGLTRSIRLCNRNLLLLVCILGVSVVSELEKVCCRWRLRPPQAYAPTQHQTVSSCGLLGGGDSVEKVNQLLERGVVTQGSFTPVLSLADPVKKQPEDVIRGARTAARVEGSVSNRGSAGPEGTRSEPARLP
ncbi:unnamed protein product, partial [Pleuronectes platessa]